MNDRISDLLDEVADDGDRPLRFGTADVVARGRAARRRRTTAAAVTGAVAVAAAAVALAVVVPDDSASTAPSAPGTTATDTTTSTPTADPTPEPTEVTAEDGLVIARCRAVESALSTWTLDAQATDDLGTTATFVSADRSQWRLCTLGVPGDEVTEAWPLSTAWDTPDTIVAGGGVSFSELCPKDSPPGCSRRLYYTVQPLWDGVASVQVETPRGSLVDAVTGRSTYVVRFAEKGVRTSVPGVEATLRDADGATVLAYDFNELMR